MIKLVQKYLQRKAEKSPYSCSKKETFSQLESTAFLPILSSKLCQSSDLEQGKANTDVVGEAPRVFLTMGKCLFRFCFIALNSPFIRRAGKYNKSPKMYMTTPNHLSHPDCKKMGQAVRTKQGGPRGRAGCSFPSREGGNRWGE